jgi:ubiquinone/menaquinone biosynthesis C-methylase UbiE
LIQVSAARECCNDAWEAAYCRFETAEEEIRKFTGRLVALGADSWPRDTEIVEIFCGRANGLVALERLGFTRLEGVDLSASLLSRYRGSATLYVCDCRQLPFDDRSRDLVIVQGGLHHLYALPDDLERTLAEAHRVLRDGGKLAVVEPWLTPFLSFVHFVSQRRLARRLFNKIDAFAAMTENEAETYFNWLSRPREILALLRAFFRTRCLTTRWGKLMYVGEKGSRAPARLDQPLLTAQSIRRTGLSPGGLELVSRSQT